MTKSEMTILLLLLLMFSVVGCGAGPCAGYGCPAFAPMVAAAPQQRPQNAESQKDSTRIVQARVVASTAPSGQ